MEALSTLLPEDLVRVVEGSMNERYRDNNKNNDGTKRNVPNASDIAKKLGVEDFSFGLASTSIVERNRKTYGKNEIDLPPLESYFSLVIQGLKDPTLVLLCASALVSFLLSLIRFSSNRHGSNEQNGTLEALSILLSVVVVVNVQASTEYQKTREFRKQQLELEAKRTSTVYRTGFKQKLHPKFLVVGDVCLVKVGDIVPADCVVLRLEGAEPLCMDESALTGESKQLEKRESDCLISGTCVMRGQAKCVVVCVGARSIAGQILSSLSGEAEEEGEKHSHGASLTSKITRLANQIGKIGTMMSVLVFCFVSIRFFVFTPRDADWGWFFALEKLLEFFILSITVLVVAVPEGLPLAVTLALAVSLNQMNKEHNQVKHLNAVEAMAGVDVVCTDKTGTLTENKMKVVACSLAPADCDAAVTRRLTQLCCLATALDSKVTGGGGEFAYEGNATDCAIIRFAMETLRVPSVNEYRRGFFNRGTEEWGVSHFPFSSERKMMSLSVREGGNEVVLAKGATGVLLGKCAFYVDARNRLFKMDDAKREEIYATAKRNEDLSRRVICLAYKEVAFGDKWEEENLVYLCLLALQDPLREGIASSIAKCKMAGVDVKMLTGDSLNTARAIANECGILEGAKEEEEVVMLGSELDERIHFVDDKAPMVERRQFRMGKESFGLAPPFKLDGEGRKLVNVKAFVDIAPKLKVLARCGPLDKLTLVTYLQRFTQNDVAVTGDGTNDAPALKKANVGFAMGKAGTDVAKAASDIILLNDSFASIVRALVWGRNIHEQIQKFLQFQLTVNVTALSLTVLSLFLPNFKSFPLSAIQMLWVNMIMDSLGSLSLATEKPNEGKLLKNPPISKADEILTTGMKGSIVLQSAFQLGVLLSLLIASLPSTVVFNVFVLLQLFNQINARSLDGSLRERFSFHRSTFFWYILAFEFAFQVVIVQYLFEFFDCQPLEGGEWVFCLVLSSLSLVYQCLVVDWLSAKRHIWGRMDGRIIRKILNEVDEAKHLVTHSTSSSSYSTFVPEERQRKKLEAVRRWQVIKNTILFGAAAKDALKMSRNNGGFTIYDIPNNKHAVHSILVKQYSDKKLKEEDEANKDGVKQEV